MSNRIKSIKIFGSGCPACHKLHELVKEALAQLNINIEVEYIQDMKKILELGVMSVPVLMINDKILLVGQVPSLERIKELINSNDKSLVNGPANGCSCGGNCQIS